MTKKLIVISLISILITGCASQGIKREDRDLTNSYDGDWVAKHQTTNSYQKYGIWQFTCPQQTAPITLSIEGSGIVVIVNHKYIAPLKEAYISSDGSFKTALQQVSKARHLYIQILTIRISKLVLFSRAILLPRVMAQEVLPLVGPVQGTEVAKRSWFSPKSNLFWTLT